MYVLPFQTLGGFTINNELAITTTNAPEQTNPLILVVHASVGSGHKSAANAIAEAFKHLNNNALASSENEGKNAKAQFPNYAVEVLDILDFGRIVFDGNRAASMFTGPTRPIYDWSWRYTLTGRLLWGGGTVWARAMYPNFTKYVRAVRPAAIVATHITAANVAVAARMILGAHFPVVCVTTDYEAEGLWPHLSADAFCVATESMAETLRPRHVPNERIHITGIPTRKNFQLAYNREETCKKLNLPKEKRIVLALAGASLPKPYVHIRAALEKILPYLNTFADSMHFAIVAGADKQYANKLRTSCAELGITNATIFEYVDGIAALMAASDVVICKSGGLTVTECLCAQVPMILIGRAYGQEKANVNLLTSLGAAMHTTTWRELLGTLRNVEKNPESVRSMLVNGNILRKPNAACDIAKITVNLIDAPKNPKDALYKKRLVNFYWGEAPAHVR